jgi:hypothetical protein
VYPAKEPCRDRLGHALERAQQQEPLGPEIDPDWSKFGEMVKLAGAAIKRENPDLPACSAA